MGPAARSPVDAASGSGPFGLHSTQVRPNKKHVNLRVSGWEAGEVIRARAECDLLSQGRKSLTPSEPVR